MYRDAYKLIYIKRQRSKRTEKPQQNINILYTNTSQRTDMTLNPPATGGQFHRLQRVSWEIVV